jgi:hypothetical protein
MAQQIQFRRGTSAEWAAANPILAQGELGINLDGNRFKIGTGLTSWNYLDYTAVFDIITQPTTAPIVYPTFANNSGVTNVGIATSGSTSFVYIPSTGNLGIGTTNATSKLTVAGNISVSGFATFGSNLLVTGIITATDFNSASDIRLKENIQKIDNPIDKIIKIDGVRFDWKSNNKPSMGVIAQNIEEVLPELVNGKESKTVNYNGIIGLLIECVKTQQEQIDNLTKRLDDLTK